MVDGSVEFDVEINSEKLKTELEEWEKKIAALNKKISNMQARRDEMEGIGADSGKAWDTLNSKIEYYTNELKGAEQVVADINNELNGTVKVQPKTFENMQNALNNLAEKTMPKAKKNIEEATKAVEKFQKTSEKTGNDSSKLGKSIFSLGKMFKLLVLRMAIRGIIKQVQDGFHNLVLYSKDANKSASMLASSLEKLKNSLASAFAPILNAIAPILSRIIDLLSNATNAVARFFAAFTGQKKVVQATKAQKDYAKSLKDSAKASKTLAGFDTIQKIGDNKPSVNEMFEDVAIDEETLNAVDKFKKSLEPIAQALKKLEEALSKLGTKVFDAIVKPFKELDLSMFSGVFKVVGAEIETISKYISDNSDFAAQVFGNLADLLCDAIKHVADFFEQYSEPMIGIITKIGDALTWIVQNILVPLWNKILQPMLNWLVNTILPLLLTVIGKVIEVVNKVLEVLKPIFEWAWKNVLSPIIDTIVNLLIPTIETIEEVVETVIQWISDGLDQFLAFLDEFNAAINEGTDALFELIKQGFKGFINWMLDGLEAFINAWIRGINRIIDAFNKISFSVPSWVPVIGGKTWGFNLPKASEIQLPRLATGTVVPPNAGEFAAILGDNKRETEVVSPLSTMKQAMMEAMSEMQGSQNITIKFDGDMGQLIRLMKPYIEKENTRVGRVLVKGV